jgi:hypothetical protein
MGVDLPFPFPAPTEYTAGTEKKLRPGVLNRTS